MGISQYILLAETGLHPEDRFETGSAMILGALPRVKSTEPAMITSISALGDTGVADSPITVIDTVFEDGPKLVEMDDTTAAALTAGPAPVRAMKVVEYPLPERHAGPSLAAKPVAAPLGSGGHGFTVLCRDAVTGDPLPDCRVVAYSNFANKIGGEGVTDMTGHALIYLNTAIVARLYVVSQPSHWGAYRANVQVTPIVTVDIQPVDRTHPDAVRHYYGASRFEPTTQVVVGVIDTGLGPHPDLNIVSMDNTVTGEPRTAGDDWFGHGTHVAGLAGARGGLRGLAPGVAIRGYRVFGLNASSATNYAIMKAMIHAAADRCDIINLSLGGGQADPIVEEAVRDACDQGMLVIVAAGNGGHQPVSYPAAYAGAVAVSALGVRTGFPPGSLPEGDIEPPVSATYTDEFIAGFSNIGQEIALTAPGVGVLSTLPQGRYGPMSGTSMAAPVAAGAAACLLSRAPNVWNMPRDRARTEAIRALLLGAAGSRGFGSNYEGQGMPEPAMI